MSQANFVSSNSSESGRNAIRVGKACEPCRNRKTRCDISTRPICSECTKRGLTEECRIREKARPNRPAPRKAKETDSPSSLLSNAPNIQLSLATETPPSRLLLDAAAPAAQVHRPASQLSTLSQGPGYTSPSGMVESILRAQALDRYSLQLDLAMPPENIFNARQSRYLNLDEMGLAIGSPASLSQAQHWINTHFSAIHHNTPFLHLPQVLGIAQKVFGMEGSASGHGANDELALLYAVLALGSLREQTYDPQTGQYRSLVTSLSIDDLLLGFGLSPQSDQAGAFRSGSTAQSLFRLAQEELEQLEEPSEAAVQALFLLHMFVSNTSMGRRSRDYVARAVMMSHEVGLNRPACTMRDEHATCRRSILYLYVYFSDVYLSALESRSPLIKQHDYDPAIFAPIVQAPSTGIDAAGTSITGLQNFVDLVTTIGRVLERLHAGYHAGAQPSIDLVLGLDKEMDDLRGRLGTPTFNSETTTPLSSSRRAFAAGSLLRQIHYNWSRIALRAPFLRHTLLKHSALSICARSALSILHSHQHILNAGILNLPWMQLRRVATSIYIVFIALWAGEITHWDAEIAVKNTLEALCIICTRWKTATSVARTVVQLADKSGVSFDMPVPIASTVNQPGTSHTLDAQVHTGNPTLRADNPDVPSDNVDIDTTLNGLTGDTGFIGLPDFAGIDLSSFGIPQNFTDWQISHQPPW